MERTKSTNSSTFRWVAETVWRFGKRNLLESPSTFMFESFSSLSVTLGITNDVFRDDSTEFLKSKVLRFG